ARHREVPSGSGDGYLRIRAVRLQRRHRRPAKHQRWWQYSWSISLCLPKATSTADRQQSWHAARRVALRNEIVQDAAKPDIGDFSEGTRLDLRLATRSDARTDARSAKPLNANSDEPTGPSIDEIVRRRQYNAAADFVDGNVARGLGDKVVFTDPE